MSASTDANGAFNDAPIERGWQSLRLIGGVAALAAALVFRRWLSAEFGMLQNLGVVRFRLDVTPTTPVEWFTLLETHRFVGALLLNAFDLVNYLLAALMYLGIYSQLRTDRGAHLMVALACTIAGTSVYLSSNQSLALLSLSRQYFATGSESQRQLLLAAGQFALTANDPVAFGTGVFWSYMLFYLAGLILSIGMVTNHRFTKWIGIVGVVANAFGLCYFVTSLIGPTMDIIPALGSAPTNLVWYMAVGISLVRRGVRQT